MLLDNSPKRAIEEDLRIPPPASASCATSCSFFNHSGAFVLLMWHPLLVLCGLNARPRMKPSRPLLTGCLALLLSLSVTTHGNDRSEKVAPGTSACPVAPYRLFLGTQAPSSFTIRSTAASTGTAITLTRKASRPTRAAAVLVGNAAYATNVADHLLGTTDMLIGNDAYPTKSSMACIRTAAELLGTAAHRTRSAIILTRTAACGITSSPQRRVRFFSDKPATQPLQPAFVPLFRGGPRPRPPPVGHSRVPTTSVKRTITFPGSGAARSSTTTTNNTTTTPRR